MNQLTCRCVSLALTAFAPAAFADNLVPNPDFTQWLTGWSFVSTAWVGTMEADFGTGSPAPPSAHVYGSASNVNSAIASACISLDAPSAVDFSFDVLVVAGTAVGDVIAYADDTCADAVDGPGHCGAARASRARSERARGRGDEALG